MSTQRSDESESDPSLSNNDENASEESHDEVQEVCEIELNHDFGVGAAQNATEEEVKNDGNFDQVGNIKTSKGVPAKGSVRYSNSYEIHKKSKHSDGSKRSSHSKRSSRSKHSHHSTRSRNSHHSSHSHCKKGSPESVNHGQHHRSRHYVRINDSGRSSHSSHSHRSRSSHSHHSHSSHSYSSQEKEIPLPFNPDDLSEEELPQSINIKDLQSEIPVCDCPPDFTDPLCCYEYGSKKWVREQKKLIKYLDMEAESLVWKCDFNKHQVKHVLYDIWEVALGNLEQASRKQFIHGCKKLHVKLPPCAFSLIFDIFDHDHTQSISRREFVINLAKIMNDEEELLEYICEMVDFRKDKIIDKLEFVYAMSRLVAKSLILRLGNEHKIDVDPHMDLYHHITNSGKLSRKHTASELLSYEKKFSSSEGSDINDAIGRRSQSSIIPTHKKLLDESSDEGKKKAPPGSESSSTTSGRKHRKGHHGRKHHHNEHPYDSSESSEYSESHWIGHENDSHLYSTPDIDHQGISLRLEELFDFVDKKKRGYITFRQMKKLLKAAEFYNEINDVKKSVSKFFRV
eukprot:TRINITY_DN7075_c0_g1_i1.p1 TRINITY_DN7075_c0_g1~~TRINITY_DN7075_c0_g1_i1.p1  ORF type:complete len:570 (-),score=105.12 TRINITY_DN7075_c0_g1_i1:42-1751(-)